MSETPHPKLRLSTLVFDMSRFLRILALAPLLVLAACLSATPRTAAAPPETVRVEKGIVYATAGRDKLQLDIAMPPGPGPFPCIVMLHGGAWQWGSRKELSDNEKGKDGQLLPSWIQTVASKGYVTATVGYRLAPKYKFPAMFEDVRSAVRFLRANAATYHIDPKKFGAVGFSAGAQLALLLGLCDKSRGFDVGEHLDESGQVQCVVDFFGPTDLKLYAATPGIEDGWMVPFLGKDCKTDPNVYKRASPLTYVTKEAPPILILHGTFDLIVPIKHSEELYQALKDAGTPVEMVTIPFGGHGGWNNAEMDKAEKATFAFLDKYLKEKP